jgi:hypothetical protein
VTRLVAYGENGRRVGESHHHATIPQATVDEIRELHEDHGWGYRRIAKHLGLAWYTVAKIAKYQRRVAVPRRWERIPEATEGPTEA